MCVAGFRVHFFAEREAHSLQLLTEIIGERRVVVSDLVVKLRSQPSVQFIDEKRNALCVCINALSGRVDESVHRILSLRVGEDEGELPLVATRSALVDVRQAHEDLVPSLLQGELHDGTCGEVLVGQSEGAVVLRNALVGLLPFRCGDFDVVEPNLGAAAIPLSGNRSHFTARAAVVVELNLRTDLLFNGRIDVSPSIGSLVVGRTGEEGRHGRMPNVTKPDAGSGGVVSSIGLSVQFKRRRKNLVGASFGRQGERIVSVVGEGVGDAPADVGLLDVGDGFVLQRVCFVEEEATLKVSELIKFVAYVREGRSATFDVCLAPALPGTFGGSKDVGVDVVLTDDVGFGGSFGVVPSRTDCACHVCRALLFVEDVALIDSHQVGIDVKVVGVVVAAVDVGESADNSSGGCPHLRHVTECSGGRTCHKAVPHDHLLAFATHIVCHGLKEVGIGDGDFVAADVNVGGTGKNVCHFVKHDFECGDALVALHVKAHGSLEGGTVAGHVDFGDDGHTALGGVVHQLAALVLGVELSGIARHVLGGGELRIGFHFKTPGEFLGEMPMEDVHLETGEVVNFALEFIKTQERASHVVHETAHLEGGPVGELEAFESSAAFLIAFRQLTQGLGGTNHAGGVEGTNHHGVRTDVEAVGFIGEEVHTVVERTGNLRDDFHSDGGRSVIGEGGAGFGEHGLQKSAGGGVGEAHTALQVERSLFHRYHLLGKGKQVRNLRHGGLRQTSTGKQQGTE